MLHLAYQDESEYRDGMAGVFCVTALVFKLDVIRDVVQAMQSDFHDLRAKEGGVYSLGLLLHGSDMLPDQPDERKLRAFKDVVKNVARFDGKLIRIGYYTREFSRLPFHPFGPIHMALVNALTMNFRGEIVEVYEMDLSGYVQYLEKGFSGLTHQAKEAVDLVGPEDVSAYDPHRIIESLFCPKRASWPLMMCDVAGHLLKVRHQRDTGASVGPFNSTLLPVADSLTPHVIMDQVVRMRVGGSGNA